MSQIQILMRNADIFEYGTVHTNQINVSQEVRKMCEVNTCQQYGKTWTCPPAVGTVAECKARLQQFDTLLVFSVKYALEDSFDYEGMTAGMTAFKKACRQLDETISPYLTNYLFLANEGCDLCKQCTYPHAPCRFPHRAHSSLESYGIWVSELAKKAGIQYNNGKNTVTYFGGIACQNQELEKLTIDFQQ